MTLSVTAQERELLVEILLLTLNIARPEAQDEPERVEVARGLLAKLGVERSSE